MIERHCHHHSILPRLAMILGLVLGCAHGTAQDGGAVAPPSAPATQPAADLPSQGTRTSAVPPNHDDRPRPAMDPTSREALLAQIDLSNPKVDLDKLSSGGVPRDGIPALVDPARMPARDTTYPPDAARVAVVEIAGEAVAYPINVLAWHEIVNDTLAREPIVVIYCPLCDSVSVMKRRVTRPNGDRLVLEFGVSGPLVPADAAREQPVTVTTPAGDVVVRTNDAGIEVLSVPESVQTVQTFYHSWSAFHPRTTIVPPVEPDGEVPGTTTSPTSQPETSRPNQR